MNSYEELDEESRKQVDATIFLIENNLFKLDEYQKNYIREHLSNLVQTCLYIQSRNYRKARLDTRK